MEIDDYFDHKRTYRKYDRYHRGDHHPGHGYSSSYGGGRGMEHYGFYLVNKIWSNRKLRLIFIMVSLFLVALIILFLIAIIPFILRIVDSIAQTGLKGITENLTAFIEKLWSGSGN